MLRKDFLARLQAYLELAGIRHFRAYEVCDAGRTRPLGDGRVATLRPAPPDQWGNFLPTLRVLERLRAEAGGHPLHVVSGYRDPAYNWAVGGKPHSLHLLCNAVDFYSGAVPPRDLALLLHRHPDGRKLGIGLYPGFVHLDTRGLLGHHAPARWGTPQEWWT